MSALDTLHRALESEAGHGLIITRNNISFSARVQEMLPSLSWTVLTKEDLRGWGAARLLALLQGTRWRAMIIEDAAGEVDRRRDLYRAMLLFGHGSRWLVASGNGEQTAERFHPVREIPSMMAGFLAEGATTARALARAYVLDRRLAGGNAGSRRTPPTSHIAYLRTTFWFDVKAGGATSHALGVIGGMRELGMDVRVWSTSQLPQTVIPVNQTIVRPGKRPSFIEEAAVAAFNRTFVQEVLPEVRQFDPAVVYHRHDAFSLAGLELARQLRVPLVLEVNGSEVWARRAWSRLRFESLARSMERTAFRMADRLVLVSEELIPTVVELGADRDRIVVSPNGVDVERFHPEDDGDTVRRSLSLDRQAIVCGFLGTFTRWHGVLFLAGQIPLLVGRNPRLHFLFLGDGDLQPRVRMELDRAGVSANATFTGLLDSSRVPGHLAACDILLSPHLPFEDGTPFFGSPTKLFEYMAAGRPVVASRLGQIGRVVEDGESGLLYPPGDGEAFRKALLALAEDPDRRWRMGETARRRAETRYTWKANVRRALEGLVDLPQA